MVPPPTAVQWPGGRRWSLAAGADGLGLRPVTRLDTQSTAERQIIDFRRQGVPGVLVLGRYHYARAHPALHLHRHEHMLEVCYLARGEQTYQIGPHVHQLQGGDVFLTYPGELHGTGCTPEEKGDLYWLIVDMRPRLPRFLNCEGAEGRRLQQTLGTLRPRHFRGSPAMKRILEDVFSTDANLEFAFRKSAMLSSLVRFLLEVLECARQARQDRPVSPPIQAAQDYVEAHLTETVTLADLAARAGISLSRFKSRFRLETGIPPAEYVARRKLRRAKELLVRPGWSVTRVAFELGFSSSQHFATVFNRFAGQSPRAFMAAPATLPTGADRPPASSDV